MYHSFLFFILAYVYPIASTLLHFRKNLHQWSLVAMEKRGKAVAFEKSEMIPIFSDTTCSRDGGTSTWETIYDLLEEEKPRPLVAKATTGVHVSSDASYLKTESSFLHCIATRPKIIPYINMVKWIIDVVDFSDKEFNNSRQGIMGSFSADSLRLMYNLPEPQKLYSKQFLEKFSKENEDSKDVTPTWIENEGKIRCNKMGMYSMASISPPYSFAASMLCRLFDKPDSTKFSLEWLPLIEAVVNTTIMNWAQNFSDNFVKAIMEYRRNISPSLRVYPTFFMSAFLMDTICFSSKFPIMGWKWIVKNSLPIHVYHKSLWESHFHPHFHKIFQGVMLPMHKQVYNITAPRFSKEVEVDILHVARWFREETFTNIRVFGSIASPHVLPYYVPNKLMAREASY